MTRRLTITMVTIVAGSLLLAGLGSIVLVGLSQRRAARDELAGQAARVADAIHSGELSALENGVGAAGQRRVRAVQQLLKLQDSAIVRVDGPNVGRALPDGVHPGDLDGTRLVAGQTVAGRHGSLVFAAAPITFNPLTAVVLTRRVGLAGRGVGLWFLLASLLALVVAAVVATDLGRRLTQPVRAVEDATRRIAAGDLAVRLPVPTGEHDELTALASSVNAMAVALERSRGLERQFLLTVSHDLRTPLTSIRGYAEAIAERRTPDAARAGAVITSEARRLERLVGDLLELAKLDARRFSLDVRATDVGEVVTDTAEGFRPAADDAAVALYVDAPIGTGPASADPDRLAQVVANLVENALKFASSRIHAGASRAVGGIVVWVDDDGPGIAPDDLPHVFDHFYSSARAATRQVGTGLGLAIVRELVEAMGGAVRAEPSPLGGARMVVTLRPWSVT